MFCTSGCDEERERAILAGNRLSICTAKSERMFCMCFVCVCAVEIKQQVLGLRVLAINVAPPPPPARPWESGGNASTFVYGCCLHGELTVFVGFVVVWLSPVLGHFALVACSSKW